MTQEFLQNYFHADFKGIESLVQDVLVPLFGESEQGWTELTATETLREKAANVNISRIKHAAQLSALGFTINVFDVTLKDNCHIHKARKGIQTLIRQYVEHFQGAFIAFHYENPEGRSWRLSYLEKQDSNVNSTSAKRYTYLCGKDYPCRTLAERFALLDKQEKTAQNIEAAFSVEALSDEFFTGYRSMYQEFCDYVTAHRDDATLFGPEFATCDEKFIRDYVKKMMGRITFLHFLQRKGWLGQPRNIEGWGRGNLNFMHDLFAQASPEQKADFLDEILEPIFFECLNEKRDGDFFDTAVHGIRLVKIPYLNGGLFERDEIDKPRSTFPAEMFERLFDFFGQYNFTIDESDPLDTEVGVDPEMLGKIFENLLEDNKDKGAFYTPKEIVNYMCREALIAYLVDEARSKSEVNKQRQDNFEAAIRAFVIDPELTVVRMRKYGDKQLEDLNVSLSDVRICDPAIGSGAFPMGLLNLLVTCRSALNEALKIDMSRAELKKRIISNNIYGVDIEKGAIDIARLRFWLSIVVDLDDPEPLPNFDYKFMQGNSLLEYYNGVDLSQVVDVQKKNSNEGHQISMFENELNVYRETLQDRLEEYFKETDHQIKQNLRREINELVQLELDEQHINVDLSGIDVSSNDKFFLWHTWFRSVFNRPSKHGFDIVIGNPPYISAPTQMSNPVLASQRQTMSKMSQYKWLYQKWDLYIPFMELGIRHLCKDNGIFTMIVPFPLTNQLYSQKVREALTGTYCLYELVDLNGTKVFDNATVSNCIPFVKKSAPYGSTFISKVGTDLHINRAFEQPYDRLVQDNVKFVWNVSQEERNLDKYSNMHILGDYCYISKGMCLFDEDGTFKKEDLLSLTKDSVHSREYIEGKNIEKYNVRKVRYLEYGTYRSPGLLSRPTFPELYDRTKIVFNILGHIAGIYDDNGYMHNNSLNACVLWHDLSGVNNKSIAMSVQRYSQYQRSELEEFSKHVQLKYLLGVMNSKYMDYILALLRGDDYHIYPEHVRNIPIPSATQSQQQPIVDLVDTILAKKKTNPTADISAEEQAIDNLVYDLYGLTEDERKLIER